MTVQLIDTPDNQRGTVNAQAPLAIVPGATLAVTVGIPPNTETLVILTPSNESQVEVTGVTTGLHYPGLTALTNLDVPASQTFFVDVTSVLDQQVTITIANAQANPWYVYADAGTHIVADISKATSRDGTQFVYPSIPNTGSISHPQTELQLASVLTGAGGAVVAAPGANLRNRIFSMSMSANTTTGLIAALNDAVAGKSMLGFGGGSSNLTLPNQGYPMATNSALNYVIVGGAGTILIAVYYTVEAV